MQFNYSAMLSIGLAALLQRRGHSIQLEGYVPQGRTSRERHLAMGREIGKGRGGAGEGDGEGRGGV